MPAVNSVPTQSPSAVKKVNTNFSTVDYEQDTQTRRLTEYAPHETIKATKKSVDSAAVPPSSHPAGRANGLSGGHDNDDVVGDLSPRKADDDVQPLKPYQTIDAGDWDNDGAISPSAQATHTHDDARPDPTSSQAKDEFAAENDPASHGANGVSNHMNHHHPTTTTSNSNGLSAPQGRSPDENDERKKSWLGQKYATFQTAKQGRGISDEDLKTYTGKDRAEFDQWAKNNPNTGGGQAAGRVGTDSAINYGAPYTPGG